MEEIVTKVIEQCPLCGNSGALYQTDVQDPDGLISRSWQFKRCDSKSCQFVWLSPAPLESELWKAYVQYHTHTRKRESRIFRLVEGLINRLVRLVFLPLWLASGLYQDTRRMRLLMLGDLTPGKLLDVGCGGGRYLNRMQRLGWQAEGVDFDEQATRRAREQYGVKTYTGDLCALHLSDNHYDAITMSHTIEHLVHPQATLQECWRILKPGGRLVLVTPNVESNAANLFGVFWRGWEPPRHLQLFSADTLSQLAQRSGFKVAEVRTSAAASAIVYRVSAGNQQPTKKTSLFFKIKQLPFAYIQEFRDHFAQRGGKLVAQNLLLIANKPNN